MNIKKFKGFTIIELLVAIAIFGIAVVAATNLYFTSLKTKRRTESLYTVRQTGDYALSVMVNMFRNALAVKDEASSCVSAVQTLTIINPDYGETEFSCMGNRIASNSAAITPLSSDFSIQDCHFDCDNTQAGQPPIVTINFTLIKGSSADYLNYASNTFKTTVSLRSYQD